MAGLVSSEELYPYGTQGPWRQVAKLIALSSISSGLYDLKELPTSWKKHVPVPHLGDRWPAPNQGDTWGNVNARYDTSQGPDPDSYDLGRLELSSALKVPVPLPRAPGSLFAELAELTSGAPPGAAPTPAKDILEIGKLILKTTSDPVQRHFWQSHINSLIKLRMIAITRPSGLRGDESEEEKLISDAMKAEAANLANLEYKNAYAPVAAPLSAIEVETAMINALSLALKSGRKSKGLNVGESKSSEIKTIDGPSEVQDYIGEPTDGSNIAIITISKSAVSAEFKRQLDLQYPTGMTVDDIKVWKQPMEILGISKKDKRAFEPKNVRDDPKKPKGLIYLTVLNHNKAAVALQYIAENGLDTYIKGGELDALFKQSAKTPPKFLFDPSYVAKIVD